MLPAAMHARLRSRRAIVAALALLSVATIGLALYASREAIRDRWRLQLLASATGEERVRLLERLVERRCAAVVPHLLRFYQEIIYESTSVRRDLGALRSPMDDLLRLGPGAVPYLAAALDEDHKLVEIVLVALLRNGPASRAALPALLRFLDRQESYGGSYAAVAIAVIGAIGPAAAPALPALLRFRKHSYEPVRSSLYRTLAAFGKEASPGLPALVEALELEKGELWVEAAIALEAVEPGHPE